MRLSIVFSAEMAVLNIKWFLIGWKSFAYVYAHANMSLLYTTQTQVFDTLILMSSRTR